MTIICTPIAVVPDPLSVAAGDPSTIKVTLDGSPDADETVGISSNHPSYFTDLPSSVVVPANTDHVSFTVHTSTSAPGDATITASANGGQATGTLGIGGPGN